MINCSIKIVIIIITFSCLNELKSQQISHWEGDSNVLRFKCGKTMDILGQFAEHVYYLGISQTDTLIVNGKTYHALIWGIYPDSKVGYIRKECNLVLILDKDQDTETPLFILTKLNAGFSIEIPFFFDGILSGIEKIRQGRVWHESINGEILCPRWCCSDKSPRSRRCGVLSPATPSLNRSPKFYFHPFIPFIYIWFMKHNHLYQSIKVPGGFCVSLSSLMSIRVGFFPLYSAPQNG
jgi:hypothetical protein